MADNDMMANVRGGALVGAGFGGMIGAVIGWLLGASMVAIPVIGPVVGQGVLSTALVAIVAGAAAGGLLGALVGVFSPVSSEEMTTPDATSIAEPVFAPIVPISRTSLADAEAQDSVLAPTGTDITPALEEVNPVVTQAENTVVTRPVKVTAPLVMPAEQPVEPARPVKVTAPLVARGEAVVRLAEPAQPDPVSATPVTPSSWVTYEPTVEPDVAAATPVEQETAASETIEEGSHTPLMRVKRRRRIVPPDSIENPEG